MSTSTFLDDVRRTVAQHQLLAPGQRVLAAVSGGADSIALLHVLVALEYAVEVAHLDHCTRDGASAEDAAFVAEVAATLGLPCHIERRPVAQEAAAGGISFELHARAVRYDFLQHRAQQLGLFTVATGHHADDQAETLLFRLLRGTSPSGLAGIRPLRLANGVRIVRPLLSVTRAQIQDYLRSRSLPWRDDPSNVDFAFMRNRVRHELLPLLTQGYNPSVRNALCRLADLERQEDELLEKLAQEASRQCVSVRGIERGAFAMLHPAIQRRILQRFAFSEGVAPDYARTLAGTAFVLEATVGRRFDLGRGVRLYQGRTHTEVERMRLSRPEPVRLEVPGETHAFGRTFQSQLHHSPPPTDPAGYCNASRQVFDANTLQPPLELRTRRRGDRFVPLGMVGSRKLQDYFVDRGIPAAERDQQVLLTARGEIVWIVGGAVAASAAITSSTRQWIEIEVDDAPE